MTRRVKCGLYRVCRSLGLFGLARRLTAGGLRILCYHGFTIDDESDFRPGLFITPETFEARMQYLRAQGYPVISLQEAGDGLATGRLPDNAVVITIDDGFYSTATLAWPVFAKLSLPATVYVTTYYVVKEGPIFRLAVQYMFWKTRASSLDTAGLGLPVPARVPLTTDDEKERAAWGIIQFGETQIDHDRRTQLARELGRRLGVDYDVLAATRALGLMTADEVRTLASAGLDVQLHTHRHRLPEDDREVRCEITSNRAVLSPLTETPLQHFCYPSGVWSKTHWPELGALAISTATTCEPGLNYTDTPPLALNRFLDGEDISQIEFEAEVSGFSELLRKARNAVSGASR